MTARRRCRRDPRLFPVAHFRLRQRSLTTENMAASSDRNPPPFPATEEPGAEQTNMADGDIDEGEDIFVNNVCSQLISMFLSGLRSLVRTELPVTVRLYLIRRAVIASKITGTGKKYLLKAKKVSLKLMLHVLVVEKRHVPTRFLL